MGVLQRFERRLEGMVGLAFARVFKGKVHPAEIAHALQREADEQRSVLSGGRVLAPNLFVVSLGPVDFDNLGFKPYPFEPPIPESPKNGLKYRPTPKQH